MACGKPRSGLMGRGVSPVENFPQGVWKTRVFLWKNPVEKFVVKFSTGVFHSLGRVFHRLSTGYCGKFSTAPKLGMRCNFISELGA